MRVPVRSEVEFAATEEADEFSRIETKALSSADSSAFGLVTKKKLSGTPSAPEVQGSTLVPSPSFESQSHWLSIRPLPSSSLNPPYLAA
jgi:hypothetical protein